MSYFFESNIMRIFPVLSDSSAPFLVNAFMYAEQSETV